MEVESLQQEVCRFLRDTLNMQDLDVGPDTELVTTGLLDSMDVVRLVAHLERTLGITIPDGDINVGHFDSIARIFSYLEARQES